MIVAKYLVRENKSFCHFVLQWSIPFEIVGIWLFWNTDSLPLAGIDHVLLIPWMYYNYSFLFFHLSMQWLQIAEVGFVNYLYIYGTHVLPYYFPQ